MIHAGSQIRSPWHVMRSSIYALIIRNLEMRFIMKSSDKRLFDLFLIFIEPAGHILIWTAVRAFRNQHIEDGISPALFMLLGVMPWLFTYNTINECLGIIVGNRGLLFFKQIKPLDPIIAQGCSEFTTMALVFCCALAVFSLFNIHWQIHNSLRWFVAIVLYFIFVMGLGIIIACISFFSKPLAKLLRVFLRVMYLFSGIFFSAQMVSADTRQYFIINPLFQLIEISRGCFSSSSSYDRFGDLYYLFECAIVSIVLGLGLYTVLRKKMMTEIMEH